MRPLDRNMGGLVRGESGMNRLFTWYYLDFLILKVTEKQNYGCAAKVFRDAPIQNGAPKRVCSYKERPTLLISISQRISDKIIEGGSWASQ